MLGMRQGFNQVCVAAGLLVLESSEMQPVASYANLLKTAPLPPLMEQGVMETRILRHYLLIHDEQAGVAGGLAG